jgi:hypothetical protein
VRRVEGRKRKEGQEGDLKDSLISVRPGRGSRNMSGTTKTYLNHEGGIPKVIGLSSSVLLHLGQ